MAKQIKKKFIADDAIDGAKILLEEGQDVRRVIGGQEVNGFQALEQLVLDEETRATQEEAAIKGVLEEGDYSTVKALSDAIKLVESDVSSLDGEYATDTEVETAISNAKDELKGDASPGYDTLGGLEDKIQDEQIRAEAAETTLTNAITILNGDSTVQNSVDYKIAQEVIDRDAAIDAAKLSLGTNYSAADQAAMLANPNVEVGDVVFVSDDGDGKWAMYIRKSVAVEDMSDFEKIADEDAFSNSLTAEAIKTAYESNADTNAFTNAEKQEVADLRTELDNTNDPAFVDSLAFKIAQEKDSSIEGSLAHKIAAEEAARIAEDAKMLKLDGSRSMEADLSMASSSFVNISIVSNTAAFFSPTDLYVGSEEAIENITDDIFVKFFGDYYQVTEVLGIGPGDYILKTNPDWGIIQGSGESLDSLELGYFSNTSSKITGLADGVDASDAVNKGQLDAALSSAASDVSAIQAELDATQVSVGLAGDGSYSYNQGFAFDVTALEPESIKAHAELIEFALGDVAANLGGLIDTEKARIDILNGDSTVEGSVAKAISDVIGAAPEALNTLAEIAAYIEVDGGDGIVSAVEQAITDAKDELKGSVSETFDTMKEIEDEFVKLNGDSSVEGSIDSKVAAEETRALAAESALSGRVEELESVTWVQESFTMLEGQLASFQLTHTPVDGSIVAFVGRVAIFEGEDFGPDLDSVDADEKVMFFNNDLAAGGESAIAAGDIVTVKYQTKL